MNFLTVICIVFGIISVALAGVEVLSPVVEENAENLRLERSPQLVSASAAAASSSGGAASAVSTNSQSYSNALSQSLNIGGFGLSLSGGLSLTKVVG